MSGQNENESPSFLRSLYDRVILRRPLPVLIVILALSAFWAVNMRRFKMDASSDSIVLENDKDMKAYIEASEVYGSDEFLAVLVRPNKDLFDPETLKSIARLVEDLKKSPIIESVNSILNVPLFHSPDVPLMQLATGFKSLQMPETDPALAGKELRESPLFNDYLISRDGKTCIIQGNLKPIPKMNELYFKRFALREKRRLATITPAETAELDQVSGDYRTEYRRVTEERRAGITDIRKMLRNHEDWAKLHLGGVPMVIADIVRFVERDILVFGVLVIAFVAIMLALIFRNMKMMMVPMVTCVLALVWMMGYLGWADWHTTIVTSNFTSLLLIMTTENAIHLATHWRTYCATHPHLSNREIALKSVGEIFWPCLFSTFTTMVGFGSLMISGIRPVMDFGLMMTIGLGVAFAICFTFMPAALAFLPRSRDTLGYVPDLGEDSHVSIFARITHRHPLGVTIAAVLVLAFFSLGMRRLTVENRFMDYFRSGTEVRQGMNVIDKDLGGTMPLDIIVDGDGTPEYWLKSVNLVKLKKIHDHLDSLPETGKVVSLETLMQVLQRINKGKPVGDAILRLIKDRIPPELRGSILSPYVNADYSQARISIRMHETYEQMDRDKFVARVRDFLDKESGLEPGKARPVGMFLLYNNMLQTLFTSQIKTIGGVLLTCFLVFLFLFRSFKLALMGLVPNILAVTTILGAIGWLGIPLDMMTIMVAAITFGLADDNTIHYIVRFKEEFPKDRDYHATMYRCHNTVGRALSYSMITIVVGFAILTASSFLPTVYFGLFTGLAMFLALLASHTVLPMMILHFKPLGPGVEGTKHGDEAGREDGEPGGTSPDPSS